MRGDPGFTIVSVGVFAVGVSANVATFSLIDSVLVKPLPFKHPDRVARIWEAPRPGLTNTTSAPDFLDWRRLAKTFEAFAAEAPTSMSLTGAEDPVRLNGSAVTTEYFRVFDAGVQLGRTFQQRDVEHGIVHRKVMLDGQPHEVIGVLRPGAFDRRKETWFEKPLVIQPGQYNRGMHWLLVHGRLHANSTPLQAPVEIRRIARSLPDVTPWHKPTWLVEVETLRKLLLGNKLRQSLLSDVWRRCAGAADHVRQHSQSATCEKAQHAIRRWRYLRRWELLAGGPGAQMLTETLVLALLAGAAGMALASVLMSVGTSLLAEMVRFATTLTLEPHTTIHSGGRSHAVTGAGLQSFPAFP